MLADDLLETLRRNGMPDYTSYFVATVGTRHQPCPRMVPGTNKPGKWFNQAFSSYTSAEQGLGLLVRSDWQLVHLFTGDSAPDLEPTCLQISAPSLFLGDRETEARCLILARLRHESKGDMIVGNVHLTKLRDDKNSVSGAAVRLGQIEVVDRALVSLREHAPDVPIVLLGDFNAEKNAPELGPLYRRGLVLVTDSCSGATHIQSNTTIDLIWVWPPAGHQVRVLSARIMYGVENATDHRPVEATFEIL